MLAPLYAFLSIQYLGLSGVFFFLGTALLSALPFLWIFSAPTQNSIITQPQASNSLCKIPIKRNLILDVAVLAYAYASFAFLEPTIAIQLQDMGMEEDHIGLVISGITLVYTLTNLVLAYISHYQDIAGLVNVSAGLCVGSLLVMGPVARYLEMIWMCVAGMIMLGVGTAMGFSSVFAAVTAGVGLSGDRSEAERPGICSIFNFGMNFGEITGPVLAGVLEEVMEFSSSCAGIAGVGVVVIALNLKLRQKEENKSEPFLITIAEEA